ncbi:putative RNA-directed DNA polymerase [Tanacetum coccineum]
METNGLLIQSSTDTHLHLIEILENKLKIVMIPPVVIPNDDSIPVEGKGKCTLKGGAKIKGVLYIPKFTCNLLSVGRLSRELQSAITFFPDFYVMQKLHTRSLIGAGEYKNGLYRMGMLGVKRSALMTTVDIWHKRLGHAFGEKLTQIDFLRNFTFNKLCDSCSKAKHTRLPFQKSEIKTRDCFELLHCDILGKYRVPSFTVLIIS